MILDKTIKVKWTNPRKNYYIGKGYTFTKLFDVFDVAIEDLDSASVYKIAVKCDECGSIFKIPYCNIVKNHGGINGHHRCRKCSYKYMRDAFKNKYGVNSPIQVDEFKAKIEETNLNRYNARCVFESEQVKEKIRASNIEKYGAPCTLQVPEFKEKALSTMNERYDCSYPVQNKEIKNKIFEKRAITLSENHSALTSKQQIHICNLLNGKLNVACSRFIIDIVVGNIAVEYDGGGHCLDLKLGRINKQQYDRKAYIRDKVLKEHDYKILRITSSDDKLVSDSYLLKLFRFCKAYLVKTSHTWIKIDLDSKQVICAEQVIAFEKIGKEF